MSESSTTAGACTATGTTSGVAGGEGAGSTDTGLEGAADGAPPCMCWMYPII